jgi:hypothetical protein
MIESALLLYDYRFLKLPETGNNQIIVTYAYGIAGKITLKASKI